MGGSSREQGRGLLTTELFPEKVHEMGPSHGVFQEFPEAEGPLLHTEPCGHGRAGGGAGGSGARGRQGHTCSSWPTPGSPGCIHGPVGIVVCDPGVAGQAPRHDGVVRPTLAAKFQVPGGGGWCQGQCRECCGDEGAGGRVWALGWGSPATTLIPLTPQGRRRTSPGPCPVERKSVV